MAALARAARRVGPISCVEKAITALCVIWPLKPLLEDFASWLEEPLLPYPEAELLIVMVIAPVLLNGVRVPLVGRVSMDMITVDLRDAPDARVGDRATLWGGGLDVDEVARHAGTIAYELFCRLTPRVRFEVV